MDTKNYLFCLVLAILLVVSGCKSTKFTTENLPETQLIFGNGGGFSGLVNQYLLLENGQLFEKNGTSENFTELPKVKKKQAAAIFTQLETMSFAEMEMNEPGNVYNFVNLLAPEVDHKLTWGKSDYEVDTQVESLYKNLLDLVKKED